MFLKKVSSKIKDKSIRHSIFRIQNDYSITWGYYVIAFIEYMLAGKILLDYADLYSLNNYEKMTR